MSSVAASMEQGEGRLKPSASALPVANSGTPWQYRAKIIRGQEI
jgi:hypothetical protein